MSKVDLRQTIDERLRAFGQNELAGAALGLLDALGYRSERQIADIPLSADEFKNTYAADRPFNEDAALTGDWKSIDLLFQLTDEEVRQAVQMQMLFDSRERYDDAIIESFLFAAIDLQGESYPRQKLAAATRALNRLFPMPVIILFRHGEAITLSIIRRRLHKREESKDVLEKVTLIKDIRYADPLRAHLEMLTDLALPSLHDEFFFHNFVGLHRAWEKRLDTYQLNERFYRDVANWYFWALEHPELTPPRDVAGEDQRAIFLIRLLTRLIFCWFLQEKNLIPRQIFYRRTAQEYLKDFLPSSGTYYRAFLQNLFFATLNLETEKRGFRYKNPNQRGRDGQFGIDAYRYADFFTDPAAFEAMLKPVPFLNGGLFERLDQAETMPRVYLDDFSEHPDSRVYLPNDLFFGEEREVDLSHIYEDKRRSRVKVSGLIETLSRYKFTIEENTPHEEEIALDPELLGKVFENLLASYNEETRTTARKATGSFYTRREIVGYMVDEALVAYLSTTLTDSNTEKEEIEKRLRQLLDPSYFENPFSPTESERLVAAIGSAKILDPACGSGAFPMGMLQRLVELLRKLDPDNTFWRKLQKERVLEEMQKAYEIRNTDERRQRLTEIDEVFDRNEDDYGRKLYLIENSIFGVDIQPIAVQITKLRFFISLIVDQKEDASAPNRGVRPLPNLETKIVAADSLVFVEKTEVQMSLLDAQVDPLRDELAQVRHKYFNARNIKDKADCKEKDRKLRREIAALLQSNGLPVDDAERLATWDPYDQNQAAPFFDPEWMYGLPRDSGFDIVIGNPPYVRIQTLKQRDPKMVQYLKDHYVSARKGNYDIYVVFVEQGLRLLQPKGNLAYILPHKFFNAQYGEPLRGILAEGKHLFHIVHFGYGQVFAGASTFVCLLFLHKAGSNKLSYVQVDDLDKWLATKKGVQTTVLNRITSQEWNFVVGPTSKVFNKLDSISTRFIDLTANIAQGIRTSANDVYVLDIVNELDKTYEAYSKQLDRVVTIEKEVTSLFLQGRDIKPYRLVMSGKVVILPYKTINGRTRLLSPEKFESEYPLAFDYLQKNKDFLEQRENGKMHGSNWYGYIYPKNIEVMKMPKLLVPDIANQASFAIDEDGKYAYTSGYGIILKDKKHNLRPFLALMNSRVLDFYWRNTSTTLRGGYYRYFSQFIEKLPIPAMNSHQVSTLVRIVDYLLELDRNQHPANHKLPLLMGYFEQLINGLVYELFFPEDLHAQKLTLFHYVEEAKLPALETIPQSERLERLSQIFEQIYDLNHPIRGVLHALHNLEIVRIIEGEK
jgi:adenine-specific DNA-methyltransferase